MKILGIDPGMNATGYGLIEFKDGHIQVLEAGTIEPKPKDLFQNRIHKIYNLLNDITREYSPDVLILEKLYAHYKHPMTASIMGHVRGVICLICAEKNIELVEHSVKRIRKAVVGNGNATKEQTRRVVGHILKINDTKLALDASDALALAIGYAHMECLGKGQGLLLGMKKGKE